jgi:hypothetical protein
MTKAISVQCKAISKQTKKRYKAKAIPGATSVAGMAAQPSKSG